MSDLNRIDVLETGLTFFLDSSTPAVPDYPLPSCVPLSPTSLPDGGPLWGVSETYLSRRCIGDEVSSFVPPPKSGMLSQSASSVGRRYFICVRVVGRTVSFPRLTSNRVETCLVVLVRKKIFESKRLNRRLPSRTCALAASERVPAVTPVADLHRTPPSG